ncbi:MAG TPA: SRPBCC family protein [Pseudonocardia sp.]|jgi:carbon monoxide dehydrogenase subunit G|nr:SRPBCC family protein [Pseudonocardia sp.]
MELTNTFTIPTGIDEAWIAFNDPNQFAPCFPGATLSSTDADSFTGTVKVKLGPISLTYKGTGTYIERDEAAYKVIIDASGRDARGNGTASAKVTGTLAADGPSQTKVTMITDMKVTGRPAQFGRGVMADVSDKIIGQFASCLSNKLGASSEAASGAGAAATASSSASAGGSGSSTTSVSTAAPATTGAPSTNGSGPKLVSAPQPNQVEAINLLDSAGAPVIKRLVPVLLGLLALFIVIRRLKNR